MVNVNLILPYINVFYCVICVIIRYSAALKLEVIFTCHNAVWLNFHVQNVRKPAMRYFYSFFILLTHVTVLIQILFYLTSVLRHKKLWDCDILNTALKP
ncbi:unnamed protein product [Acanthoscelides obtectus]|uniref:Uncharacterized protein n=1 Tax=Acanthoscelides obtectus TaxID=200917 RepID=A0A9P0PKH7_ACAOB|nr:unnamed protein product [Acanthoscelides obtectus]